MRDTDPRATSKRWQSDETCVHWTAAGMLEAERQFCRIIGHGGRGLMLRIPTDHVDEDRFQGRCTASPRNSSG